MALSPYNMLNIMKNLAGIIGFRFEAGRAAQVPLQVKAAPSQTANLFEAIDSNDAVVFSVSSAGNISGAGLAVGAGTVGSTELDEQTIQYASVVLTNAQVLAVRATPITVIAAPGAGKFIEVVSGQLIFNRTAAYTETADNLQLKYVDGTGSAASQLIEATGFVDAAGDAIINILPNAINSLITAAGELSNALVCIHNTGDGEFGGGDAANTITVKVAYRVHTTGL